MGKVNYKHPILEVEKICEDGSLEIMFKNFPYYLYLKLDKIIEGLSEPKYLDSEGFFYLHNFEKDHPLTAFFSTTYFIIDEATKRIKDALEHEGLSEEYLKLLFIGAKSVTFFGKIKKEDSKKIVSLFENFEDFFTCDLKEQFLNCLI